MENNQQSRQGSGRVLLGFVILAAGVLMLLRRLGYDVPAWIFTWPACLIWFGLFIGARRRFKSLSSFWLIVIGAYFLGRHQGWIRFSLGELFWPLIIIAIGLSVMFRSRNTFVFRTNFQNPGNIESNNFFESVAVFWGARKTILSKNFSKGDIVNVFGGTEINFIQADITDTAVLDVVVVFGGVKLIVPAGWDVRVNTVHIFAGTDDKRQFHSVSPSKKVLLINGTVIFGGIDISSY